MLSSPKKIGKCKVGTYDRILKMSTQNILSKKFMNIPVNMVPYYWEPP